MATQALQYARDSTFNATMWRIDPARSTIGFSVKHMKIKTVHGHFAVFRGTIRFDRHRPGDAQVEAEIDATTIDTGIQKRDDHLRSADFLDVAVYPTISFRSTRVDSRSRFDDRRWIVSGDLTICGVTRTVELAVEQNDGPEMEDDRVIVFSATTRIGRSDFGMSFSLPVEGAGFVVGDEATIAITIQANRITS